MDSAGWHLFVNNYGIDTKKYYLILLLFSVCVAMGTPADEDTAVVRSREVKVSADAINSNSAPASKAKSVITRSQIRAFSETDITNALQSAPGIYIKNYGGLGGLKTISVRGTTSQQTLVMIDGIRINSAQSGMTDLGSISPSVTEQIDVVRGGASASFGGSAIGGAVNIRTAEITKNSLGVNASTGAFGERTASVEMARVFGMSGIHAIVDYRHSDGDYSFTLNNFGTEETHHRNNSVFDNYSAYVKYSVPVWGGEFRSNAFISAADRGVPGAVVQGHIENSNARMKDKEIISINKWSIAQGVWNFSSGAVFRINNAQYSSAEGFGTSSDFTNRQAQWNGTAGLGINNFSAKISAEAEFSDLRGNMLQKSVAGYVSRKLLSSAATAKYSIGTGWGIRSAVECGVRLSSYSDNLPDWSPMVGVVLTHSDLPILVRAEYSSNYRPPSFNEMYYLNYGTSDLRPEKSHTFNLGISYDLPLGMIAEADLYSIQTRDQIVAVQKSILLSSAKNLDDSETKGVELSVRGRLIDSLAVISLSYSRQQATDRSTGSDTYGKLLVYSPEEILSATIGGDYGNCGYGVRVFHASHRFATADNDLGSMLPSYTIVDCFVSYRVAILGSKMQLKFDVNNLFDEQFMVILNYPMPGRAWRISAKFEL